MISTLLLRVGNLQRAGEEASVLNGHSGGCDRSLCGLKVGVLWASLGVRDCAAVLEPATQRPILYMAAITIGSRSGDTSVLGNCKFATVCT